MGKNDAQARLAIETLELTYQATGKGTEVDKQDPGPGTQVSKGTKVKVTLKAPVEVTEQMVTMTLQGSLQNDPDRSYEIFQLLNRLAEAVDGGSASHIQMTLKIAVTKAQAEVLVAQAEAAEGQNVRATDM